MNKSTVKNFAKRVYHLSKRTARMGLNLLKTKNDRLVFVFGGRNDSWPTVGRDLYKKDLKFRNVIQSCDSILSELGGSEILSYFEGPINNLFFEDESKFTCITSIQLATVATYNDQGVFPNAVMGVSMGEPAAAYAAGALTLREALSVSLSYMTIFKFDKMQYVFIYLNLGFSAALEFCNESPVWAEIIYEDSTHAVLITCHQEDFNQLQAFIKDRQLTFKLATEKTYIPYHTSLIKSHRKMLKGFHQEIEPKPLKCDYYSPTLGKVIPKNTFLSAEYWYDLACVPVLFISTLQSVINDGYKTFVQIGPPAISKRQFSAVKRSSKLNIFNSLQTESDEMNHQGLVLKKLSKIKFEKSAAADDHLNTLNNFKQNFNIYAETTSALQYQYLRKEGPLHFLPAHHAWLLLGYDDIDHVLKHPQIFSSSLLKEYDPILLGADPEMHQVIRSLLHPLFSPAVIAELAGFTTLTAKQLLDSLCKQDNFDFVTDYSDPLSVLVLCNFFGLSSSDANNMLDFTGKDYHNPLYWQRLEEFFKDQFITCELTKEDSLWGKLRALVQKDQFAFSDATSLMRIIWTAGMATTSALISSAIYILLDNPQLAAMMSTDEKLVPKFIEECLRLQTPLTAIHRITTTPVELSGQQISANTVIMLQLRSAMTDPDQYANPEEFSINRPAKRHLSFGTGIHQCIGMGIARAEARSALQIVLTRIHDLEKYSHAKPKYSTGTDLETMLSLNLSKN